VENGKELSEKFQVLVKSWTNPNVRPDVRTCVCHTLGTSLILNGL